MLFITGLLTLLAIAQAGGDHVKGGSVTQQKVAQEDIIPSPFNIKSATAPFGTKVIQQEATDPISKTARGSALHHAVKTAATTPGKTQLSPGLHHAASSPVIQDQITIDDPASGSMKNIKTLKTAASVKTRFSQEDLQVRDPIARSVVQTVKTVQDPVAGTRQIKTVKTVDRVIPRFSQEDKQVRDPISRPVIQSVKTTGDPSASVVTKTIKTAEPSNLRSKTTLKTSRKIVESQRLSNAPLSVVEAARKNNFITSSDAGITSLSSQTLQDDRGLLLNAPAVSQMQPGSELVSELGELILDEKTLQTLQNAGGIINENGRIALNDEGLKILQSIRGGSSLASGTSGTGMGNVRADTLTRTRSTTSINPSANIRSSSGIAGSTTLSLERTGMSRRDQIINAPAMRSQTGNIRSTVLSSNILSAQNSQRARGTPSVGSVASGTALFNGKEISIDGLKEGQIFDENLRPVLSDFGRIETPASVAPKPIIRTSQRAPATTIRSSALSGVTTSTAVNSRSSNIPSLRAGGSFGARTITSQRTSQATGMRTTNALTSGTALFKDKEITIDGLKEGQLFDESLKPITPETSLSSSGQISGIPTGNVAFTPSSRSPQRTQSAGLRSPTITGTSRTTISRSRTSNTLLSQSTPNVRTESLSTTTSSGRTQTIGGIRSGSLTSGAVLFNGKEINVDGLKEGQIFDENLRPITPGASLSSSGQISGVPTGNAAFRPSATSPQRPQSAGLRSPTITGTSRTTISRSRTSNALLSQSTPNVRTGSLSTTISSGRTQTMGGIRSGSLTSGAVLFNGKEINVDGLKEGQIFDENLRPITPGASLSSSGQISGVPTGNAAFRPSATSPQRPQSAGLRSPTITGTSRTTISRSRTSNALLSQSTPNARTGSLSTTISSGRTQTMGGIRSGSLTSGAVLFNGKEINVDGLKEGQIFDENLRPITPGASLSNSGQISGVPTGNAAFRPSATSPQRPQSAGLRSPTITGTSRATISRSRTSSTLLSQSVPFTKNEPLNSIISSEQGRSQGTGGITSGGSLTSGTALYNGKEISVDGLKKGEIFDENLQPILSGISGIAGEKSTTIQKYGEINAIPSENAGQRSRSRLTQTGALRSSAIASTYRGTSRISSSMPSQTASVVRSGSLTNVISPEIGISQIGGSSRLGSSLTSGTVLFNGKEVSVDGLREGQIFDENLKPISPGSAGIIAEKSSDTLNAGQVSFIPLTSAVDSKPRPRSPQRLQAGALRSSAITSSTSSSRSSSRRTNTLLSQGAPAIRTGPLSNTISSEIRRSQTLGGITSGGSLTSGSVLFNGKEISIDGLKEGQIFDENLRPVLSGPSGMNAQGPASISSSAEIGGIPSVNVGPKPGLRSAQRMQGGNLRSSAISSSSRSTISSSRGANTLLSQVSPQRLQAGTLRSGGISRSSGGVISSVRRTSTLLTQPAPVINPGQLSSTLSSRNTQILGGVRSSNSLTSGTVLFNGKEIRLGGMKEGQIFDEKLQPINTGSTGFISEKSANLPGTLTQEGISTENAVPEALLTSQRYQAGRLRSSVIRGSSGSGAAVASAPNASDLQAGGMIRSGGSLASGTMLFDGKEISIDGMKVGQIFNENLQPITTGTSGIRSEGLTNVIGSTQTSGMPSRVIPKPRVTSRQQYGSDSLRSSTARGRGVFKSSRISSPSGSLSTAAMRTGSLSNTISSTSRSSQAMTGTTIGGSLTSGTALFNGKEIKIDGLKEGQIFDENLKPVLSGTSEALPGRMSETLQGARQINAAPSVGAAPKPRLRTSQRSQIGGSRSSVISNSLSGAVSTSRSSSSSLTQSALNTRRGSTGTAMSSGQRISQALGGVASINSPIPGSVLFNGKEINIEGLKPGQFYDENLKPITSGTSGIVAEKPTNLPGSTQISRISPQNLAPKPVLRARQQAQTGRLRTSVVSSTSTGTVDNSRILDSTSSRSSLNLRAGPLPLRTSIAQYPQAITGIRSGGSLTSGTALFDGKEISIDGLEEGRLYDENLRPIIPGTSGTLLSNSASFSSSGQTSGILPLSIEPKPISRTSQQSQMNRMRATGITSSRSSAQSLSNVRAGSLSSGVSSAQGLSQTFGGARSSEILTSSTVLFNGKEVSIDGLKEGQIFDENLRPISSAVGYAGSPRGSNIISNVQRSSSTRNLGTGTSSAIPGLRSQTTSTRGSPAASGTLNYIDVTRTDESSSTSDNERVRSAQRMSLGGASEYANTFGSRGVSSGNKVTQDRITPEISQYGVDTPIQESILNIPDDPFKKSTIIKIPSVSRQTQLKVDDIFEQSSVPKPDILRSGQVQEPVSFSTPESSKTISKKTLTKITQISQKDMDIPTVQQKLLGDFSGYLPKTSFLPPFNYALPQLSTSKYRVQTPLTQQKVEQVFV